MSTGIDGRVIAITGGGSGMGRAMALALAEAPAGAPATAPPPLSPTRLLYIVNCRHQG